MSRRKLGLCFQVRKWLKIETVDAKRGSYFRPKTIPPEKAYVLPAIWIDNNAAPATETKLQADIIFEKIKKAPSFKSSKIAEKKRHLQNILHAVKHAMYHRGSIINQRNYAHRDFSKARLQVIKCLIEKGFLYEFRSPKGSPKMSRLFPTRKLQRYSKKDPFKFDPNAINQKIYVFLVKRGTKANIPFGLKTLPKWHIAVETQKILELINSVNNQYKITYWHYCPYERDFIFEKRLRPVHYAKFTERWDLHGRLYTGKYGHQSLRKIERQTIRFNGCPSVELDYSGLHTRFLYHLFLGIDYKKDPYALWGKKTTKEQRLLVKTIINIALNAKNRRTAISQCNNEMSSWANKKDYYGNRIRKTGESLERAISLYEARKTVGMTFDEIYELVVKYHRPIIKYFHKDKGIELMRLDSEIAISIMKYFAKEAIPCLCCHDSFIVPRQHEQLLRKQMDYQYHLHLGHSPVIKRAPPRGQYH